MENKLKFSILISLIILYLSSANIVCADDNKMLVRISRVNPIVLNSSNGVMFADTAQDINLFRFANYLYDSSTEYDSSDGYIRLFELDYQELEAFHNNYFDNPTTEYIYVIAPSRNILNISSTLREYNPLPNMYFAPTHAAYFMIPSSQVIGWYQVNHGVMDRELTRNRYYNPIEYPAVGTIRSNLESYILAGFPSSHHAWLRWPWRQISQIYTCVNVSAAARKKRSIDYSKCNKIIKKINSTKYLEDKEIIINRSRSNMSNLLGSVMVISFD